MSGNANTSNTSENSSRFENQTSNNNASGTSSNGPWSESLPLVQGLLSRLNSFLPQTSGPNQAQTGALNTLESNATNSGAQYGGILGRLAQQFMSGGGVSNTGQQAYDELNKRLSPVADSTNWGANNPGLKDVLSTIGDDVQSRVNGMFAGAGRDLSGANQQAVARGIAQGQAPVIADQFNADRAAATGAANTLYGAGTNLGETQNRNALTGAGLIPAIQEQQNLGANATLDAEARRLGIPMEAAGMLVRLGIPLAGLGSTSTYSGMQNGTRSGTSVGNANRNTTGFGLSVPLMFG